MCIKETNTEFLPKEKVEEMHHVHSMLIVCIVPTFKFLLLYIFYHHVLKKETV